MATIKATARPVLGSPPSVAEVMTVMKRMTGRDADTLLDDAVRIAGELSLKWPSLDGHNEINFEFEFSAAIFDDSKAQPLASAVFQVLYAGKSREWIVAELVKRRMG